MFKNENKLWERGIIITIMQFSDLKDYYLK